MYEHKGRIKPIQLGVGAAFSFITGKVKQAPYWIQKLGLEWLYRLTQEPKKTIIRMSLVPEFLFRTFIQFLKHNKRYKRNSAPKTLHFGSARFVANFATILPLSFSTLSRGINGFVHSFVMLFFINAINSMNAITLLTLLTLQRY